MEIRRFFVDKSDISGDTIVIRGGEFTHMTKVLRHKVGYKIIVNNDFDGLDYFATLTAIDKDSATASVDVIKENPSEPKRKIALFQALPKGDKPDFIVQKAVELGVEEITFFRSAYSDLKSLNVDRLQKIAVEACKQCGRATVPKVAFIKSPDAADFDSYDKVIFMNEREREKNFDSVEFCDSDDSTAVIVGSEGGFSEDEAIKFIARGAFSVTLGRRILRAETASVAALVLTAYKLGELNL